MASLVMIGLRLPRSLDVHARLSMAWFGCMVAFASLFRQRWRKAGVCVYRCGGSSRLLIPPAAKIEE